MATPKYLFHCPSLKNYYEHFFVSPLINQTQGGVRFPRGRVLLLRFFEPLQPQTKVLSRIHVRVYESKGKKNEEEFYWSYYCIFKGLSSGAEGSCSLNAFSVDTLFVFRSRRPAGSKSGRHEHERSVTRLLMHWLNWWEFTSQSWKVKAWGKVKNSY